MARAVLKARNLFGHISGKFPMKYYLSISIIFLSSFAIAAQNKDVSVEVMFTDLARPTATKLPVPDYPAQAKKHGLGGRVSVSVTVDDRGKVVDVKDAAGPYPVCQSITTPEVMSLRNAATEAAQKATFSGAIVEGKPSWAKVLVIYTFPSEPKTLVWPLEGTRVEGYPDQDTGARAVSGTNDKQQDQPQKELPNVVSGGVLNGKANSLAKPMYPPAARAVRATGSVTVQVLIDEDGNMYSAEAVSGHPLLRYSAVIAACNSKFMPTVLSGKPVKVAGVITYNYVP